MLLPAPTLIVSSLISLLLASCRAPLRSAGYSSGSPPQWSTGAWSRVSRRGWPCTSQRQSRYAVSFRICVLSPLEWIARPPTASTCAMSMYADTTFSSPENYLICLRAHVMSGGPASRLAQLGRPASNPTAPPTPTKSAINKAEE